MKLIYRNKELVYLSVDDKLIVFNHKTGEYLSLNKNAKDFILSLEEDDSDNLEIQDMDVLFEQSSLKPELKDFLKKAAQNGIIGIRAPIKDDFESEDLEGLDIEVWGDILRDTAFTPPPPIGSSGAPPI